jgi:hypothetical protein
MNEDFIKTPDANLCSALVTLGYEVELEREYGRKVTFKLNGKGIKQAERKYWNNKLVLPARELLSNRRDILARVFNDA